MRGPTGRASTEAPPPAPLNRVRAHGVRFGGGALRRPWTSSPEPSSAPRRSGKLTPVSDSLRDVRSAEEHVVVAAVIRRNGRALLVHRCPGRRWYPDAWDLPGGHVELGEQPVQALVRELWEELGIDATVDGERFAHVQAVDFRMDVWVVDRWSGEPFNRVPDEHDALAWLTAPEMGSLSVADPRLPALVESALRSTT